jgi:hypothetical protein
MNQELQHKPPGIDDILDPPEEREVGELRYPFKDGEEGEDEIRSGRCFG